MGIRLPKCKWTTEVMGEVVRTTGIDANIDKVEDISETIKVQVMITPAEVIDGQVVLKGRIPNKEEVIKLLMQSSLNYENILHTIGKHLMQLHRSREMIDQKFI